ncbi:MAG: DUF5714 domain-containing protein [Bacilli bacterium]|nr:DUF5714 domain-containing protein [Bacilli bacterium]
MEYSMEEKYRLIREELFHTESNNPIDIVRTIAKKDFINIHGPEHHFLDGAALLTSLFNDGMEFDLVQGLDILAQRTIKMPGAMCGHWGVCGAAASIGAVLSIIDGTGPLSSDKTYSKHMEVTSRILARMSEIGGPRCCKRNAFVALTEGIKYINENFLSGMPVDDITCEFSEKNAQCLKEKCPFNK